MSARGRIALFAFVSVSLGGYFGAPLVLGAKGPRALRLLPGTTTPGHASIEEACSLCHTPFGGVTNAACNRCHAKELAGRDDSHPESKFTDPRNAERVALLDARACVTCHREHAPDRTRTSGVTLPADFCWACHQDVAEQRPSHQGFSFQRCADAGCHRFHDNRALYEAFLGQHLHEPDVRPSPRVPLRRVPAARAPLTAAEQDAPLAARADASITASWEASAHARAGVNCGGCHDVQDPKSGLFAWKDRPGRAGCAGCHAGEEAGFLRGKHGMRESAGLSPLTTAMARLPMKPGDHRLGCESCHPSHASDTRRAALEACLGCHDDRHSLAFAASRHAALFEAERAGKAPPGTGVSCATCHLPRAIRREGGADVAFVVHDQNANLRPSEAMVRGVCLACHGLGFSLDALADRELVARNFNGRPAIHVGSLDMAERRLLSGAARQGGDQ